MIDGPTLLAEALDAGVDIVELVGEPDASDHLLDRAAATGATVHRAAPGALAKATATVTPQPLAAIAPMDEPTVAEALAGLERPELVLALVAVNDPGNAGTLLRSADAVGTGAVLFCDDSVDPYNPKCVRAAAGSLFRLQVVRTTSGVEALRLLRDQGIRTVGTVARGGSRYDRADLTGPTAIVVGSEAHGLPAEVESQLDEHVSIPMRAPVESLNVAMAGTLVCFEAMRQRSDRPAGHLNPPNPLDDARPSGAGCSAA